MLFVPAPFIPGTVPLTHSYVAHASHADPQGEETFAGVSLGTAQSDRYIIACIGVNEDVDYVQLDGANMTRLGPRMFIIYKPTGTTGTFYVNLAGGGNYLSVAVLAVYGMKSVEPWDTAFGFNESPAFGDIPYGGVAIGAFNANGSNQGNTVTQSGLTARLNTTVDGRRVWIGSDNFVDAVTNKQFACTNGADDQYLSFITLGPTAVQQVSPDSLGNNLIGWWDPSDTGNRTLVSGKVSQLTDKSGHAYNLTQSTDTKRPTLVVAGIGGRDCMSFSDAVQTVLIKDGLALGGTTVDVFVVCKLTQDIWNDYNRLISFVGAGYSTDYDNPASFTLDTVSTSATVRLERDYDALAETTVSFDTNMILAGYFDGTYGGILKNLTEAAVRNSSTGTFGATGYFRLGDGPSGEDGWNGYIGEVVFAKNLTRTQRRGVYAFLKAKWSIT